MVDISVSPNAAVGSNCTLFCLLHDLETTLWDCVTCDLYLGLNAFAKAAMSIIQKVE
jgi:hypothetical protein